MAACCVLGVAAIIFTQSGLADAGSPSASPIVLRPRDCSIRLSASYGAIGVLVVSGHQEHEAGCGRQDSRETRRSSTSATPPVAGVIDAHVHFVARGEPQLDHDWFDGIMRFPAEQAMYGAHYAKATLEAAVTTVRDVAPRTMSRWGCATASMRE